MTGILKHSAHRNWEHKWWYNFGVYKQTKQNKEREDECPRRIIVEWEVTDCGQAQLRFTWNQKNAEWDPSLAKQGTDRKRIKTQVMPIKNTIYSTVSKNTVWSRVWIEICWCCTQSPDILWHSYIFMNISKYHNQRYLQIYILCTSGKMYCLYFL